MKKLFLTMCVALLSLGAYAQQGAATIGVHGAFVLENNKNVGIGANIGYEFVENLRGVAEFDYYFKKDHVTGWEVDVNGEYLFRLAGGKFAVYPLVGVNVFGQKLEGFSGDSKVGLNLGGGVEIPVASTVALKVEYTYKTQWDGCSFLKAGVVIPF